MQLSYGRDLFMTPGPSVMPDRVLNAMHRAAPNIYEGPLVEMVDGIFDKLRQVARTSGDPTIYIANGHGAWEAALHNTVAPGQKVLVLTTGRFGYGWAEVAEKMGMEVELIDFGNFNAIDPAVVAEHLSQDKTHEIKSLLVTHTDTSTSICNDIPAIRQAMNDTNHPALLQVDCIASLGSDTFEMDEWGVDVMVAGSQKGLMTPPGMAFTFHNNKAWQVASKIRKTSPYWDWEPRINGERFYQKFSGTPPTHLLFGLDEALNMIVHEEGIENVWARHKKQAETIWAAVDVWAKAGALRLNVADIASRSCAVTTIVAMQDMNPFREFCTKNYGLTLGIGIGMDGPDGNNVFRIGHMGHMNPPMLLGALASIDAGLKAQGIAHGEGAIEAANKVIAAS